MEQFHSTPPAPHSPCWCKCGHQKHLVAKYKIQTINTLVCWKTKLIEWAFLNNLQRQSNRGRKLTVEHICRKTSRISFWITLSSLLPVLAGPFVLPALVTFVSLSSCMSVELSEPASYLTLKSQRSNASLVLILVMIIEIFWTFSSTNQSKKNKKQCTNIIKLYDTI